MRTEERTLQVTLGTDVRDGSPVRVIDFSSVEPYASCVVKSCTDTEAVCEIGWEE